MINLIHQGLALQRAAVEQYRQDRIQYMLERLLKDEQLVYEAISETVGKNYGDLVRCIDSKDEFLSVLYEGAMEYLREIAETRANEATCDDEFVERVTF